MAKSTAGKGVSKIYLVIGQVALFGLALFALYALSRINFLLFHTLVELFSLVIAFSIFIVTWNARAFLDNPALLFIGIAYLFVAILDLFRILDYEGLSFLTGLSANQTSQIWLAARFLQAGSLVIAMFYTRQKFRPELVMAIYAGLSFLLIGSIFVWGGFPTTFIHDQGLTPFKIGSEFLITGLMVAALALLLYRRRDFHPDVARYLALSVGSSAVAEIALVGYVEAFSGIAVLGNLIRIVAFSLIYKAVADTGLVRPYELLFHNLQQSRDELRRERDFVTAILDTTYAMVVVLDADARILRVNRTFEENTGHVQSELSGLILWETGLFGDQSQALHAILEEQMSGPELVHFESYLYAQSDRKIHAAWDMSALVDKDGNVEYITLTGMDITDRKRTEDELRFLSTHDALTGLYNRAYFEQEMVRLAETDQFPASIVIADVDGLKAVNDTYGHLSGDKLLQRTAHIMRSAFRTEDVIARMGGDEFAILLADADEIVADHAQRRVRAILAAHNQVNPDFQIGISLGAATAIAGYMLMETYKHADQKMYHEKQEHKSKSQPSDLNP